mgnify:CR=1 FL=1
MRNKREIIKDFNEAQQLADKLLMEIGFLQVRLTIDNEPTLTEKMSDKIKVFRTVEFRLRHLENELSNSTEE